MIGKQGLPKNTYLIWGHSTNSNLRDIVQSDGKYYTRYSVSGEEGLTTNDDPSERIKINLKFWYPYSLTTYIVNKKIDLANGKKLGFTARTVLFITGN